MAIPLDISQNKIKQLLTVVNATETHNDLTVNKHGLIALTTNGSIWKLDLTDIEPKWKKIPNVPFTD